MNFQFDLAPLIFGKSYQGYKALKSCRNHMQKGRDSKKYMHMGVGVYILKITIFRVGWRHQTDEFSEHFQGGRGGGWGSEVLSLKWVLF